MSRKELKGERLTVAFGLDHVCGPFVQVWLNQQDDQDEPIVVIDNQGVRYFEAGEDAAHISLGHNVSRAVRSIGERWSPQRCNMAADDINKIVTAAGLPSHVAEIYAMLS